MWKQIATGLMAVGLLAAAVPAEAQGSYRRYGGESELRFRLGNFEPDAESVYWDDTFFDFTGSPESFEDVIVGVDYVHRLGNRVSLIASGSVYESEARQAYRDFVDGDGRDIRHDTFLEIGSGTVGLLLNFAGRDATIQPYIGGGGGFYAWTLEESGDFIDFTDDTIFSDTFLAEGTAFGTFFVAGISIPIGDTASVFAEGRWDSADDELGDDFDGLGTIDLSGRQLSAGFSWRF